MAKAADHDASSALISAATAGFVIFADRNPLFAIGTAAIIGIFAARLGA